MKDWPTDPIRQHNRFIAAMCDDWLTTGVMSLDGSGATRVAEINRQVSKINRDGGCANNAPPTDQ